MRGILDVDTFWVKFINHKVVKISIDVSDISVAWF